MQCPFCRGEMEDHLPPLRERYREIYYAVAEAGPDGIRVEDLQAKLPNVKTEATVRVRIHYTNKKLSRLGQKIVCRRDKDQQGRYFLTALSTGA